MKMMIIIFSCLLTFSALSVLQAQSLRSLNNNGVEKYKDKKFADAEVNFKKGLDKEPANFITNFNLGDAYYQQQRYDEALNSYKAALSQAKTKNEKAKVYHNIGNSLLKSKQIKESIEAYKNSLKLNPNDEETKYNLSYALDLLKNQKNQQKQNQDKNQQQNKDQQKKDQKDKQNQQRQQNKDQNKNQEAKQDATQQKQQQNKISKKEAERILQALKNNEKDLQKKLRKMKGKPIKTDKDW
jgi:Ca-activated chloride channel homolog